MLWPIILKRSTRFLENVAGESPSCVSLIVSSSWLMSSRASASMLYVYVSKGYVRKIKIVNDYFSGWYVYNVLNWCEIERDRRTLPRRLE